ncbi:adenylate isopentenyltransferase 3, chloroplastic-like [Impatiens glandulifera]|uniref:adenylate isopentenyltransferase 3, chloroplastic-like n=1 Tax=Impatiens glandulifera TaxID=253017 RepID=UPI001FB10E14|nr:adenylate isopentenyltransferase 3, chloroplastic-like [Impatiens glandulifera]
MSTSIMCKQMIKPLLNITSGGVGGTLNLQLLRAQKPKEKVVVIMGATGTGKSRLSIDLATRFPAEIINCDKIQAYRGLEITTNKITDEETRNIPHHLLGIIHPNEDFTANNFCSMASTAVRSITTRSMLPIIAGGSNNYIEALISDQENQFHSKYDCCFIWVDVSLPVLHSFVSKRVDTMVEKGMVEEVRNMFDPRADYSIGIRRAIGVPEFDTYFRMEHSLDHDEETKIKILDKAIANVKSNSCKLASHQTDKINRLKNVIGWKLHRIDATNVFMKKGIEADEEWDKLVLGPSSMIVRKFLFGSGYMVHPGLRQAMAAARSVEMVK